MLMSINVVWSMSYSNLNVFFSNTKHVTSMMYSYCHIRSRSWPLCTSLTMMETSSYGYTGFTSTKKNVHKLKTAPGSYLAWLCGNCMKNRTGSISCSWQCYAYVSVCWGWMGVGGSVVKALGSWPHGCGFKSTKYRVVSTRKRPCTSQPQHNQVHNEDMTLAGDG